MFVQIVEGKVADAAAFKERSAAWRRDLKPGAKGYLGSTGGVTPDGRAIVLARFESQAAADANSNRPEQGAWWAETEKTFSGPVTFRNCTEVDEVMGGGSNDAGFVQVIQGRVKDQDAFRTWTRAHEAELRAARPDILALYVAWHGDGGFSQVVYFKDEAGSRQMEGQTEESELRKELMSHLDGPPTFADLPDPELD